MEVSLIASVDLLATEHHRIEQAQEIENVLHKAVVTYRLQYIKYIGSYNLDASGLNSRDKRILALQYPWIVFLDCQH